MNMKKYMDIRGICVIVFTVIIIICLMPIESYAVGYKWVKQIDFIPANIKLDEIDGRWNSICGMSDDGRYVAFMMTYVMKDYTNKKSPGQVYLKDMKKGRITLISKSYSGKKSNYFATTPGKQAISGNGKYAVFQSEASNLVKGDTNKKSDIFLYDRNSDSLKRISIGLKDKQANGHSCAPAISGNGRYVYYTSFASNLVGGPKASGPGFYRYDMKDKKTVRLPLDESYMTEGSLAPDYFYKWGYVNAVEDVSHNGRYITFSRRIDSETKAYHAEYEAFRYDVNSDTLLIVSKPVSGSALDTVDYVEDYADICNGTSISGDGRFVVFVSTATNLVDNSLRGGSAAVFLYDCVNGTTRMVSKVSKSRAYGSRYYYQNNGFASISPNGRYIAYILWGEPGPNKLYVYDRIRDTRKLIKTFPFKKARRDESGWEEVEPFPGMLVTSGDARYIGVSEMYRNYVEPHSYIVKRK
jgi:Tol biopolymer transport system component